MVKRKSNAESYQKNRGLSTVRTPAQLGSVTAAIIRAHPEIQTWLFSGPLGSGKTTAIRAILRARGVRRRVVSPTYTLAQTYPLGRGAWAVHIDAYRVRHAREWQALGLDEALAHEKTTVLVEWPERLRGYTWGARGTIRLSITRAGRAVRWLVRS